MRCYTGIALIDVQSKGRARLVCDIRCEDEKDRSGGYCEACHADISIKPGRMPFRKNGSDRAGGQRILRQCGGAAGQGRQSASEKTFPRRLIPSSICSGVEFVKFSRSVSSPPPLA